MKNYKIIRSKRRSMALEVSRDYQLLVRVPFSTSEKIIENFVESHKQWIEKALLQQAERQAKYPEPTEQEIVKLKNKAHKVLPDKVKHFSAITGFVPTSIRITSAKTRFGSCNGKNAICFSYRLMQYPDSAVDYVVLHELVHIKHHNHSKRFWETLQSFMPDYKERKKLLK